MKTRLAVTGAMLLLWGASGRAGTVSVTGPSAATPGGTVTVAVTLSSDLNNVYALQGALTYDPAVLTPLPSQESTAAKGFYAGGAAPFPGETIPRDADLFRMNASQLGTLVFGYVKNPTSPAGSSSTVVPPTALAITFNVAGTAAGSTAVQLAPYAVNGRSLPAVIAGGADGSALDASAGVPLLISFRRAGDLNSDGTVDRADVVLALQLAGGLSASSAAGTSVTNGDVWPRGAGDGRVTLQDAARLFRFVSGLETDLG